MGKDLKGKELGKGLGQRKDKYYYAKYSYHGKKGQQSFHTLVEAKNWRQEQLYRIRFGIIVNATNIMFSRLSVLCCCEMSNLWTAR